MDKIDFKNDLKRYINNNGKINKIIQSKFLNKPNISQSITSLFTLLEFINTTKISSLKQLINVDANMFPNELTLFIYHTLEKYSNCPPTITAEKLIHKVLFDNSNTNKCRLIKILTDVAWHHQPYEEFAETVAKIVGYVFVDTRRRMLFENLRVQTLDSMWLPAYAHYPKLLNDLLNQCEVDGIRACKSDSRSAPGGKSFATIEEKSKETAIPYGS